MKRKIVFWVLILGCWVGSGFGQAPAWQWGRTTDGTSDAGKGTCVCNDTAGNVFIAGWFNSSQITLGSTIMQNITGNNRVDVFLAKYDHNGNVLWAKSAGGICDDIPYSVSADLTGNVFVTGIFLSPSITFGTTTLLNADPTGLTNDIFIAKYDPNGNLLWVKSLGGPKHDEGWSVSADAGGNVFLTGNFLSPTVIFGSTTLTNVNSCCGNTDIFIAKYDANGNVLWAKSGGSTDINSSCSVSADAFGNAFITGAFNGSTIIFGSTALTNPGSGDALFIAKYDANGNVLWAKSAGSHGDKGYSVSTDPIGDVYATGYFYSPTITFGNITLSNVDPTGNSSDVFIVKYDANGNAIWAHQAAGTCAYDEMGYSISADATGNVYVSGALACLSITFGTITVVPQPLSNCGSCIPIFIAKYDSSGNAICASTLSSGDSDPIGVSADHFGNAYLASYFVTDTFFVGLDTLILTGGHNIFLAKYNCTVNPETINQLSNQQTFSLFPNPSNGIFTLKGTGDLGQGTRVEIYNTLGQKVIGDLRIANSDTAIDLSDQPNGIYFVRCVSENKTFTQKIVIEK